MDIKHNERRGEKYWRIAYWILLICWVTGAILFMARIKGGFLTNYLSDLTFPAWYYIYIRGLSTTDRQFPKILIFKDWFGVTPNRAIVSIFIIGFISELKTYYWPTGIIAGTFDYLDIVAYAIGLLVCYYFDLRLERPELGLGKTAEAAAYCRHVASKYRQIQSEDDNPFGRSDYHCQCFKTIRLVRCVFWMAMEALNCSPP